MRIKKYIVDTMPEALVSIRKDLGNDAVILEQKKIKVGGFLGMFRKNKLEVTAAVETKMKKAATNVPFDYYGNGIAGNHSVNHQVMNHQAVNHQIANHQTAAHQVANRQAMNHQAEKSTAFTAATNGLTAQDTLIDYRNVQKDSGEFLEAVSYSDDKMADEIKELKSMFIKMMCQTRREDFPENLQKIYGHLLRKEVDEEVINHLISLIIGKLGSPQNIDEAYLYEMVENEIAKSIEKSIRVIPKTEKQQVFAFVGPTGVGKTTTIAKLAAYYMLEKKMTVGFITADTYRIAAVEQLRTYATILNIPIEIVISHDDMQRSIQNLRDRDIILIDTAGRNYRSGTNVAELKSLLKVAEPDETYLVLSLTTKQSDMHEITSCFKDMKVDNFIFTKADETSSFGTILNMLFEHQKALSIITNGQKVPEDIMFIDSKKLAKLIVGDRHA